MVETRGSGLAWTGRENKVVVNTQMGSRRRGRRRFMSLVWRERERDVGRPFSLFKELFVCWSLISSYLLLLLLLNIILIGKEGGGRRALLSCEREREREREKEEGRRANHKWANHVAVIKRWSSPFLYY